MKIITTLSHNINNGFTPIVPPNVAYISEHSGRGFNETLRGQKLLSRFGNKNYSQLEWFVH